MLVAGHSPAAYITNSGRRRTARQRRRDRMQRWRTSRVGASAILAVLVLSLAAAAVGAAPADQGLPVLPERTRVSYGVPQGVAFAVYVGLERGYFNEANIDLE